MSVYKRAGWQVSSALPSKYFRVVSTFPPLLLMLNLSQHYCSSWAPEMASPLVSLHPLSPLANNSQNYVFKMLQTLSYLLLLLRIKSSSLGWPTRPWETHYLPSRCHLSPPLPPSMHPDHRGIFLFYGGTRAPAALWSLYWLFCLPRMLFNETFAWLEPSCH